MIEVIRNADDLGHPGLFDYTVPEFGLCGRSRQPLLDACRQIKRAGGDPSRLAGLFREGHDGWDIRCSVEVGAGTTVEEPDKGRICFRPFRAFAAMASEEA